MAAIQITTNAFKSTSSVEQQWKELYDEYRSDIYIKQTQTWVLIAQRKDGGMTPQQAREWMKQNFHFQEMFVDLSKPSHRSNRTPKSHNIANIAAED